MKTIQLLIGILSTAIFLGCHNSEKKEVKSVETIQAPATEPEKQHHHESETIELNNGVKWKVVPKMLKYIRNMESDINHFGDSQHLDLNDYLQLGKSLQKNIDLLTSNCTMEGKAHDELHRWLVPYINMVAKLTEAKNTDEAKELFTEIKNSYNTFNMYFE